MNTLSRDLFIGIENTICKYARPLEKLIFNSYFNSGNKEDIIRELRKFQNDDGGFGHGIEPDFRMTNSSPMATSVGLRILCEVDNYYKAREMIKKSIGYLEASFNKSRNGWFVASKEINKFPHAPWWSYNEEEEMTIIDMNWGNPTAEIIAYLYKYRDFLKNLDIYKLVEYSIDYISNKESFKSENELFCYIKLYEVLPEKLQDRLYEAIKKGVSQVIVYDKSRWNEYVPRPLDFVKKPSGNRFGIDNMEIEEDLDYLINQLRETSGIKPPWGEDYYQGNLKKSYDEWIGILNLESLIILDRYGRIDKI